MTLTIYGTDAPSFVSIDTTNNTIPDSTLISAVVIAALIALTAGADAPVDALFLLDEPDLITAGQFGFTAAPL